MVRKSQSPWQVRVPFASFYHQPRNGKAQWGGLAFIIRILFVTVIAFILSVPRTFISAPLPVQAQGENSIFLPLIAQPSPRVPRGPGEWPMVGANPERTSWTATEVKGDLDAEWFVHFDAYISQKIQIIAAADKLFISAADGLHALDSNTGNELWFFPTSLPLGNSPTYSEGIVYVGGLDRNLYAIHATTGAKIWSYPAGAGFDTNPLVVNGLALAGNRDGYFYAIHTTGNQAGKLAWRYKTDAAIHFSAAYKNGVAYFASSDMHAYALDINSGGLLWKSAKLPGSGFHSWWPVIYKDYVVFSGGWPYRLPEPFGGSGHFVVDRAAYPPGAADGSTIGSTGNEPGDWAAGTITMNASRISQYFETYPQRRTTVVLNIENGQEYTYDSDRDSKPEYAPFLYQGTYSGSRFPAAVGPDNVLYQANNFVYSSGISRGHITGWKFGTTTISIPTDHTNAVDEPMAYAIGGNTVYWKRCCDRKAGSFDLTNRSSESYYDEGGLRIRRTLPELFDKGWDFAYWKHGDPSPPIPYNSRVYIIINNAVVAFSANGLPPKLPNDEGKGRETGAEPSSIERSNVFTGLNTKVTLNTTSWPLLYQQERYLEQRDTNSTRANHFTLLEVAGSSSGTPTSAAISNNNAGSSIVSSFSNGKLTTWVSKRAPAVLFESTSNLYQLRGNLTGMAYLSSSGAVIRTGAATVEGSALIEGWLLVWDSTQQHRWVPMVISLQNRPSQIRFETTGVTISYSGAAGRLAVTPLYGMSAPKSSEETSWRSAIPQGTVDRIRQLTRLAWAFPSNVTEALTINASSGDAELSYTYQYLTTSSAWNTGNVQLAYLPPHLALAAWNGSPILVNGQPSTSLTDINFLTPLGRVAGVNNASSVRVTLPGIANTWRQLPSTPGAPASGDPLQAKLTEQVQRIVQAGHLMPGYGMSGIWDARATNRIGNYLADYWHNPAETITTLINALPLLPANQQNAVREYIKQEFAQYPTTSTGHIGWATGTSRQFFDLASEVNAERGDFDACDTCNSWGFPAENHYASWMYAANFGSAQSIYNSTNSMLNTNPVFQQSLPYKLNSEIAGYIGYLRLAQLANAGAKPDAEKKLVEMLILRAALSKYPSALAATGFEYGGYKWSVRTYAPNMPDTLFSVRTIGSLWSQLPLYGYTSDLIYGLSGGGGSGAYAFGIDYVNLTPELGAFMRKYTGKEESEAIKDYERRAPYWFVAEAEEAAGEGVLRPIYDSIALFQAKAYISGTNRAGLEQYIDVPIVRAGDLYYIQKLIMALKAPR